MKVTYLEPDRLNRDALCQGLVELFRLAGFQAQIDAVVSATHVRDAILAGHCDVFACDLSLNSAASENWDGLTIIQEIKRDFPYIFVIGTTGGYPRFRLFDVSEYSFDLFIPKRALLDPPRLSGEPNYVRRLLDRLRPLPRVDIELLEPVQKPVESLGPNEYEIQTLVRQLFASEGPVAEACYPSEVTLKSLGGGRSKSLVFAMTGTRVADQKTYLRSVVKLSHLEDHAQEYGQFHKYIKWSVPYHARVDILGTGVTQKWGAIAYSFAHGGDEPFDTLSSILASNASDRSMAAITSVFDAAKHFWGYVPPANAGNTINGRYFDRYFDGKEVWFEKNSEAMRQNIRTAGHSFELNRRDMNVNGVSYPNIVRLLSETKIAKEFWSLCHGDLNTNNIIVSDGGDIALIDFRDAGIGHVFEDMVTLEACVRLYWNWTDTASNIELLHSCIQMERAMNAATTSAATHPGWAVAAHVRQSALRQFPAEPRQAYLFGLAYYCFRLLRLPNLAPNITTRLLAVMLTSAEDISKSP